MKKKLPNPVHFAAQRTFKMGIAPNKKDRIAKADRMQKQKGWEWDMKRYSYEEAVNYLSENNIGVSPACIEGEYACSLLDDEVDGYDNAFENGYYYKETLDGIVANVTNFLKQVANEEDEDDYYDADHAREWMEKHPYGYYNSERDYGEYQKDED